MTGGQHSWRAAIITKGGLNFTEVVTKIKAGSFVTHSVCMMRTATTVTGSAPL